MRAHGIASLWSFDLQSVSFHSSGHHTKPKVLDDEKTNPNLKKKKKLPLEVKKCMSQMKKKKGKKRKKRKKQDKDRDSALACLCESVDMIEVRLPFWLFLSLFVTLILVK